MDGAPRRSSLTWAWTSSRPTRAPPPGKPCSAESVEGAPLVSLLAAFVPHADARLWIELASLAS